MSIPSAEPAATVPTVGAGRPALWWRSLRAPTLLTSLVPAAAGGLTAIDTRAPDWWLLGAALLALLCLHAGTNISNEVEDVARGVDPPDKARRTSAVFASGLLSITQGRRMYGACFAAGMLIGAGIAAIQGPALLVIGVLGLLGGLLYTVGPWPYKHLGLGEAAIFWLMGPLMTAGAYTATTGAAFAARGFWIGVGPGLLIACVLASNNLDDIDSDRAAGARTIVVRLGFARARLLFAALMLAVVPAQLALWASGVFDAWILVPLLLTPLLVARAREVLALRRSDDPILATLTPRTGQLHLAFSLALVVSVVLART